MSELRKDPITREWVCISTERAQRPSDFAREPTQRSSAAVASATCPFCPGSEHLSPDDILILSNDHGGDSAWSVRVVPNKFPALRRDREPTVTRDGIFETMPAAGSHEVVIETPDHGASLARLDTAQVERVIRAWQERFLVLEAEGRRYIFIFRNHGIVAGASLEHGHSQIIASPMIPPHALQKIEGVARYSEYSGRCVYGDIVEHETRIGERVVARNESFVCFAPFASRQPFELWIVPLQRDTHFARIAVGRRRDLAAILRETLLRLDLALGDPPYNLALLTTSTTNDFHWHLEILPRLSVAGGFELGTGVYINTVAPEHAAAFLRRTEVPERFAASNGSHADLSRARATAA